MNISQTTLRIGAVLGTIGAIVVLAASAQAATSKPAGMSQPEYRALMIRSEALNTLYGNAVTRLSPRQFEELYHAGANRMAPHEFAALVARSEGLNRQYGLDRTSQPKVVEQPTGPRHNGASTEIAHWVLALHRSTRRRRRATRESCREPMIPPWSLAREPLAARPAMRSGRLGCYYGDAPRWPITR